MKYLSAVLILKIGITVLFWFIPLLFFPPRLLHERIGFPEFGPGAIFVKLLGMAYGSLTVAYACGLHETLRGGYPRTVVWTGIVSNGGAFLLLSLGAFRQEWSTWPGLARGVMWASWVATGVITTGLIAFGPCGRF